MGNVSTTVLRLEPERSGYVGFVLGLMSDFCKTNVDTRQAEVARGVRALSGAMRPFVCSKLFELRCGSPLNNMAWK